MEKDMSTSSYAGEPRSLDDPWFENTHHRRSWRRRLHGALRGAKRGIRGQSSFFVYFFFIALALALAVDATLIDWCLLLLCVAGALTAEMFHSAIAAVAQPFVEQHPRCRE